MPETRYEDFNSHLGLKPGPDARSVVLDTRPEQQIAPGVIHFAVLATIAEVSAARAVGAPVVPASLTLNLLARATPGRLEGRGTVVKKGRRLTVAEGEVHQGDRLVAKATVTFAMI
jgi:acyl-coenzyme A thioesterase PaaI-like protein